MFCRANVQTYNSFLWSVGLWLDRTNHIPKLWILWWRAVCVWVVEVQPEWWAPLWGVAISAQLSKWIHQSGQCWNSGAASLHVQTHIEYTCSIVHHECLCISLSSFSPKAAVILMHESRSDRIHATRHALQPFTCTELSDRCQRQWIATVLWPHTFVWSLYPNLDTQVKHMDEKQRPSREIKLCVWFNLLFYEE